MEKKLKHAVESSQEVSFAIQERIFGDGEHIMVIDHDQIGMINVQFGAIGMETDRPIPAIRCIVERDGQTTLDRTVAAVTPMETINLLGKDIRDAIYEKLQQQSNIAENTL